MALHRYEIADARIRARAANSFDLVDYIEHVWRPMIMLFCVHNQAGVFVNLAFETDVPVGDSLECNGQLTIHARHMSRKESQRNSKFWGGPLHSQDQATSALPPYTESWAIAQSAFIIQSGKPGAVGSLAGLYATSASRRLLLRGAFPRSL